MAALAELLIALIAEFGLPAVLAFLVDEGILPAWVLGQTAAALEHEPYLIEQIAEATSLNVANPYYGLQAINTKVSRLNTDYAQILSAIESVSVQVSNLPIPASEDDIATRVWGYPNSGEGEPVYNHLIYLQHFMHHIGRLAAFTLQDDPFLVVEMSWKYPPD